MIKQPRINLAKSKGRRTLDGIAGFTTSIGPDSVFVGRFSGPGHSIVLGCVEGDSTLDGVLVIGESGVWRGDISADTVVVAGRVEGKITARQKVEILSTALIHGTLNCAFIVIAEGAVHQGEVRMAEVKRFTDRREPD